MTHSNEACLGYEARMPVPISFCFVQYIPLYSNIFILKNGIEENVKIKSVPSDSICNATKVARCGKKNGCHESQCVLIFRR